MNAVGVARPLPPFLTKDDLDAPARRLSVLCDVTCDVGSPCNALPVYDDTTDWEQPVRRLREGELPVDLIAIENLPSLVPVESSRAFSADLRPHLLALRDDSPVWARSLRAFHHSSLFVGAPGTGPVTESEQWGRSRPICPGRVTRSRALAGRGG